MQDNEVTVHFIDVGQGDCILIKTENKNILIDGGDTNKGDEVLKYLDKESVDVIDLLIATHPHADHIGGLVEVLKKKHINSVIMPKIPEKLVPSSFVYEKFLEQIQKQNINIIKPKVKEEIVEDNAVFTIVAPNSKSEFDNLNDYSVTVKMTVGKRSFLFTGDIEKQAENDILKSGIDINVDVLKVPHHGSDTSSQDSFVEKTSPKYVVFTVGADNKYGHPKKEVEDRYFRNNAIQLRTDKNGNIVFTTNGNELNVRKEKE